MNKKALLTLGLVLAGGSLCMMAQQSLNIVKGNVSYSFPTNGDIIEYSDGPSINLGGVTFNLLNIDKMEVVAEGVEENTVLVSYNGTSANVTIAGNLSDYVTATISGAHVTIDQSDDVSDKTCGEITYILKGESSDGSFTQNGSFKSTFELQGLTLTNPKGAAIDIENGKRIELSAKNGTLNTLTDGSNGKQKAALYCKGHLELKGKGTLNVTGKTSHAIAAKEYVEMKNLTLNILGSEKDGINCAQYFLMESGNLTITGNGDDGIQVAYKDDTNREKEDTGSITIEDGTLTIENVTAAAAKGLKSEGDFIMKGGTLNITTSAPGEWDSSKQKVKASACIAADEDVNISGGTLNLKASGGGGKGITADGALTFSNGTLNIETSGGLLAYASGSLSQNYTGNADRLDSDLKSSPKGIKVDGNVDITGGTIDVVASGSGGEGIESKSVLTISDGNVKVRAYDDAINSNSHMYIKGGVVDVISTKNDGLDSNGNLYIEGGVCFPDLG